MIPSDNMLCRRIIRDRNGKVIKEVTKEAHSWVRNAYTLLIVQMGSKHPDGASYGDGYISFKGIGGGLLNPPCAPNLKYFPSMGDNTKGIVVGTSDVAFNFNQHALGSIVAHGTSSGRLFYLAESVTTERNGQNIIGKRKRTFINLSGASISIKEIGYYMYLDFRDAYNMNGSIMVIREVLESADVIPNYGDYTVEYIREVEYPE